MNIRNFPLFILLLSVLPALADKKITVSNTDTGESFEVTVPDGLKIYEYNPEWLDSIPYLLERARYGEPWAYEALGDCYRYGNSGVQQSIFKALVYYGLSGINLEEMATNISKDNPRDQLGLVYKLIDKYEAGDRKGMMCLLDTLNRGNYYEADILRRFINDFDTLTLAPVVERNIISPDVSTDQMMFTLAGCTLCDWFPESFSNEDDLIYAVTSKYPFIYDRTAVRFYNESHQDSDSLEIAEKMAKAITFLNNADKEAMLTREGAEILYNYYFSEREAGRMSPDEDDMERLAILAGIQESETFIFTDEE